MEQHKYVRLANHLRSSILGGEYTAGQRLPSENELTREWGMSRQTVRQAMQVLESEGLTQRIRGSGTYVKTTEKRAKSYNVAVITTYITDYVFPTVLNGIEKTLASKQYTSMVASTQNRVDNERRLLEDFLEKNIDGFIIEGTKTALPNPNIDLYQRIEDMGLPVVFINGYYPELRRPVYVISNDRQGGYDACQFLIDKGHRRIAGIFKSDDAQGMGRYAGMTSAMIHNGLVVHDENVLWFTTVDQDKLMDTLALETLHNCTAVVCYNDMVAVKLVELLRANSISIPKDMAIISFDNSAFSDIAAVKITSLDYPKERLGQVAAEKLLNMLRGVPETPALLSWGFTEKEST